MGSATAGQKILTAQRASGSSDRPLGKPRGFPIRLTPELRKKLEERIGQHPDETLVELTSWLLNQTQVSISVQRLCSVLREMGLRRKKNLHASEQDTEKGKEQRSAWRKLLVGISAERFVFLDESGVNTDMTRRYGRAPRGQRVKEAAPGGHWRTVTMLGAISSQGWQATMTFAAPTDGEVFLAFLRQVLCPTLRPDQIVVMDNLSAHKVQGVAEAITARGLLATDCGGR